MNVVERPPVQGTRLEAEPPAAPARAAKLTPLLSLLPYVRRYRGRAGAAATDGSEDEPVGLRDQMRHGRPGRERIEVFKGQRRVDRGQERHDDLSAMDSEEPERRYQENEQHEGQRTGAKTGQRLLEEGVDELIEVRVACHTESVADQTEEDRDDESGNQG